MSNPAKIIDKFECVFSFIFAVLERRVHLPVLYWLIGKQLHDEYDDFILYIDRCNKTYKKDKDHDLLDLFGSRMGS